MVVDHSFNLAELIKNIRFLLASDRLTIIFPVDYQFWKYVLDELSFIFTEVDIAVSIFTNERIINIEHIVIAEPDLLDIEIKTFNTKK